MEVENPRILCIFLNHRDDSGSCSETGADHVRSASGLGAFCRACLGISPPSPAMFPKQQQQQQRTLWHTPWQKLPHWQTRNRAGKILEGGRTGIDLTLGDSSPDFDSGLLSTSKSWRGAPHFRPIPATASVRAGAKKFLAVASPGLSQPKEKFYILMSPSYVKET